MMRRGRGGASNVGRAQECVCVRSTACSKVHMPPTVEVLIAHNRNEVEGEGVAQSIRSDVLQHV